MIDSLVIVDFSIVRINSLTLILTVMLQSAKFDPEFSPIGKFLGNRILICNNLLRCRIHYQYNKTIY